MDILDTYLDDKMYKQFDTMMSIYKKEFPEIFLKLINCRNDISEFHHTLWELPFYKKIIPVSNSLFSSKYIYISDRLAGSIKIFNLYELTYKKFRLNNTFAIEKRLIDATESNDIFVHYMSIAIKSESYDTKIPNELRHYVMTL
jgi:hypothetical protein